MSEQADILACFKQVNALVEDKHPLNLSACNTVMIPASERAVIVSLKYVIDNFDHYGQVNSTVYIESQEDVIHTNVEDKAVVYIDMYIREAYVPELTNSITDESRAIAFHLCQQRIEALGGSIDQLDDHQSQVFGWRVVLPRLSADEESDRASP